MHGETNQTTDVNCPFLDVVKAAKYLNVGRSTLDRYRQTGVGPIYRKHGGRVVYHINDLEDWSAQRCYRATDSKL